MTTPQEILEYIDAQDEKLAYIAREIWEHPEVALQETFASKLLADELEANGFDVEWGAGGMPTAFVATWGEGEPRIGILGEYDALPGLSQEMSATKDPIEKGGAGHGCGHNLFGTACMGAAISLKESLEKNNIQGTLRYYGCPAEETLVGKTFMARDGVFDDLDVALTWHPGSSNMAWYGSSLALNSFKVNFHGISSHAGAVPHLGRSALDGAMLMDVGVNYLREHVISEARIHSVITHGGQAPNVVPDYAQIWYYVRAPRRQQVEEIYERMLDIAQGAALMSGTTHDIEFVSGCYDLLPNKTLSDLLLKSMQAVDPIQFTEQERTFARDLQTSFGQKLVKGEFDFTKRATKDELSQADLDDPLWERVLTHSDTLTNMSGSTEVGDVSWITPTAQITTTCWALGTPAHSWQTVASSGSSIGAKGMMFAAKSLALAGWDLFTDADLLARVRAEFDTVRNGETYVTPLPDGTQPT